MNTADRIARLEGLLARVAERKAAPRPARGALLAQASAAPVLPPATAAATPAAAAPASNENTRPTAPPPANVAEVRAESARATPAVGLERPLGTPSGEFEIPSRSTAPVTTRRSQPPPANIAPIELETAPADEMEIDRAPLAVHAQSVPPPPPVPAFTTSAEPPRAAAASAAPSATSAALSEDSVERYGAPLSSELGVVEVRGAAPAPSTFRGLLLRSLSLRPR